MKQLACFNKHLPLCIWWDDGNAEGVGKKLLARLSTQEGDSVSFFLSSHVPPQLLGFPRTLLWCLHPHNPSEMQAGDLTVYSNLPQEFEQRRVNGSQPTPHRKMEGQASLGRNGSEGQYMYKLTNPCWQHSERRVLESREVTFHDLIVRGSESKACREPKAPSACVGGMLR